MIAGHLPGKLSLEQSPWVNQNEHGTQAD